MLFASVSCNSVTMARCMYVCMNRCMYECMYVCMYVQCMSCTLISRKISICCNGFSFAEGEGILKFVYFCVLL